MRFLSRWRQRLTLAHASRTFCSLLRKGEIAAALPWYEARLAPQGAAVSPPLRAAYHFHRGLIHGGNADLRQLRMLAVNEPDDSPMVQAVQLLQRHRRQPLVARAVQQRLTEFPAAVAELGELEDDAYLERLARAILTTYESSDRDRAASQAAARRTQRLLPNPGRLRAGGTRKVWQRLALWAAWRLGEDQGCLALLLRSELPADEQRRRWTAAVLLRWGKTELAQGRAQQAWAVLRQASAVATRQQLHVMVLSWATAALEQGRDQSVGAFLVRALPWLDRLPSAAEDAGSRLWLGRLHCAIALAHFRQGDCAQGREELARTLAILHQVETPGPDALEAMAQCWLLEALSRLAEVDQWPVPAAAAELSSTGDSLQEILVKNRALWRSLRSRLEALAEQLSGLPSASLAWRGHLLSGLIAYVDSGRQLDQAELERFSSAVASMGKEPDLAGLRSIEAELVNRAKATEEAARLIRAGAHDELLALYETVLLPLGEAIPPLARAAVVMTLWDHGRLSDPASALPRPPLSPEIDRRIDACNHQIRVRETFTLLTRQCMHAAASSAEHPLRLPSLTPLAEAADHRRLGALASAVIHLCQGHGSAALGTVPPLSNTLEDSDRSLIAYVVFRAAWAVGDLEAIQRSMTAGARSRWLPRRRRIRRAVEARCLLAALETERETVVLDYLTSHRDSGKDLTRPVISLVSALLEAGRPGEAAALIELAKRVHTAGNADIRGAADETGPAEAADSSGVIPRTLAFLEGLVAARRNLPMAALTAFEQFLKDPAPPASGWGGSQEALQAAGWARLFRLVAELRLSIDAGDELAARWPTVRRSLESQAAVLEGTPVLVAYGDLITGLVAYLSTERLVDDDTLARLAGARQVLPLEHHGEFLERIVSRLAWRKRIIEDFWRSLAQGRLKDSRTIYREELVPVFAERMPDSIRLAMIMVDWSFGVHATDELLGRLRRLAEEAPHLNRGLIEKVRAYLEDGDKIRALTRHFAQQNYQDAIELAENTRWADFEPGAMPVPVAIALLFAYHREKRTEDVLRIGGLIGEDRQLQQWVRDDALLLLGYVRFHNEDYDAAAQAFEQISTAQLLGHDTDRYWAACHFSRGLQLLKVEQKDKAFAAFARSLGRRGRSDGGADLAPLFLHFGLKHLENLSKFLKAETQAKHKSLVHNLRETEKELLTLEEEALAELARELRQQTLSAQ